MKEKDQIADYFKQNLKNFEADPKGLDWSQMQQSIASSPSSTSIGSKFSIVSSSVTTKVITVLVSSAIITMAYLANEYFKESKQIQQEIKTEKAPLSPDDSGENNENNIIEKSESTDSTIKRNNQIEAVKPLIEESVSEDLASEANSNTHTEAIKNESVNIESIEKANINSEIDYLTEEELESIIRENEQQFAEDNNELKEFQTSSDTEAINEQSNSGKNEEFPEMNYAEQDDIDILIPNIFTPNQDGINDIFIIEDDKLEMLEVKIIDKNNNLIHEWNAVHGFWDGNLPNGELAPQGVYFYQVSGKKNGKSFVKKNLVSLKR